MRLRIDPSSAASALGRDPGGRETMLGEQRYAQGRAYRGETLVCARVHVTIGRDDHRLGLAQHERRRVTVRFVERRDPTLHAELAELVRRRGMAARRVAEALDPIELVVDDPGRGRRHIIGRLEPPDVRRGELGDIEFAMRELMPAS